MTASQEPDTKITRTRLRRTVTLSHNIEAIREILRDETGFPVDTFLRAAMAGLFGRSVLSTAHGEWQEHRDLLMQAFKKAGFDARVETAVHSALQSGLANPTAEPFDVHDRGNDFASSVIAEILFGPKIKPEVNKIVGSVMTNHRVSLATKINMLAYVTGLPMPFPVYTHKTMPKQKDVWTLIEWQRQQADNDQNGVVPAMLDARNPETGKPYPDLVIHDNLCALIAAGYFTTGASIAFCVQNILTHPATLDAVRAEAAREDVSFANPGKTHPAIVNAIKETLRLSPPVHTVMRRARATRQFGDIIIPKGAGVHINIGKLHRNPAYFDDPDTFKPERFNGPIVTGSYMPFGFGGHTCIGQRLAMYEMTAFIAALFRHGDLDMVSQIEGSSRSIVFAQPKGQLVLKQA